MADQPQHTHGEWGFVTANGRLPIVREIKMPHGEASTFKSVIHADNGDFVVALDFGYGHARNHANARLIVAAPRLLAALKALRIDANRLCDRQLGGSYEDDCRKAIVTADAAIDKAEGR